MKLILKFCFILSFSFLTSPKITAQQFAWAPTVKIKNNFYQYYVGESGTGSVLLMSKYSIRKDFRQTYYNTDHSIKLWGKPDNEITLVKFDNNQNLKTANPFMFKNALSVFYEAFISDNMYFVYCSIKNNKCILYADIYSTDDKFIRTETLRELKSFATNDNELDNNFSLISSENHQYIAIKDYDGIITFYDGQMKKIWDYKFEYSFLTDIEIKDNGLAFAIGGTDKSASLIAFDILAKKTNTTQINIDKQNSVEDLHLTVNHGLIYVTYFYGLQGDKTQFYFGPRRFIEFFANGIVEEVFDMKTLVSKNKFKVPFSNETLLKVTEKKKIEKIKGLEWFSNKNMFVSEVGELVVVFEKEYTVSTSMSDQYGRVIRVDYATVDEDIICMKINADGTSKQSVIKRKSKGQSQYDYLLSSNSFYEKGKLYIMYNEGTSSYKLVNHILSENLQETSMTETKTYGEHDVYLAIRNAKKMKDGNYKVFGREGKNVSSAIIKF